MPLSKTLPLDQITIHDRDIYERIGIRWLPIAERVMHRSGVKARVLNGPPGIARFLNLVTWRPDGELEYLDNQVLPGDQLIHAAWHQCIHQKFGAEYVGCRLLGEVLASSSDLYLLGCMAKAGEECDFVQDTLESFNFYYDTYGDLAILEKLLEHMLENPYAQMLQLARFLYEFVAYLVFENRTPAIEAGLKTLSKNDFYPLVHHYHLPNWVVTLGGRHQHRQDLDHAIADFWDSLRDGDHCFGELAEAIIS